LSPRPGSRRALPQQRVDALRNKEAIMTAALQVLARDPDAGLAQVARASGVTRTTIYAHFASREELVEALLVRVIASTAQAIDDSDPSFGPADAALLRVVAASWRQVGEHAGLVGIVGRTLGDKGPELHAPVRDRLATLLRRGRLEGTFRSDVPEGWLLSAYFALVHAAGSDVASGASAPAEAELMLGRTLLSAFAPPATGPTSRHLPRPVRTTTRKPATSF